MTGRRTRRRASAVVGLVAACLVMAGTAPTSARMSSGSTPTAGTGGEAGGRTYRATALDITFRLDYDPAKVASTPKPPPLCWWDRAQGFGDPDDAIAFRDEYTRRAESLIDVAGQRERVWTLLRGGRTSLDAAVAADTGGDDGVTWYEMSWTGDTSAATGERLERAGCTSVYGWRGETIIPMYVWAPTAEPPQERVDAETLAEYAYRVMRLEDPTLEWNPKIRNRAGATMINLPTWLWVDDAAVGTRRVQATAGDVTVEVVARNGGIHVKWPDGVKHCTPAQATQPYAVGVPESSACTVEFTRASFGEAGFEVEATSEWRAVWTSTTGESGDLSARSLTAGTPIRVSGTQAIVTGVG